MLYAFGVLWFVLGVGAIVAAVFNIVWMFKGKETKWFRFLSLSLTALTLCAFHSQDAVWVLHEDWGALMDVVPPMAKGLWYITFISIALNGITLFQRKK